MNTNAKRVIQISLVSIFFLLIIFYALFRSHDLIVGVQIKNVNLTDGVKVANSVIEVKGNAKNAKNLTLNGREISISETGDFSEKIALLSGYNIITIKATDKFGDVDEKNYKLIY